MRKPSIDGVLGTIDTGSESIKTFIKKLKNTKAISLTNKKECFNCHTDMVNKGLITDKQNESYKLGLKRDFEAHIPNYKLTDDYLKSYTIFVCPKCRCYTWERGVDPPAA